jgi:hypothetical protein
MSVLLLPAATSACKQLAAAASHGDTVLDEYDANSYSSSIGVAYESCAICVPVVGAVLQAAG